MNGLAVYLGTTGNLRGTLSRKETLNGWYLRMSRRKRPHQIL